MAITLLQLRVFYAREQPWIPIAIIVVITIVKIAASLVAPHLTANPDLVAKYSRPVTTDELDVDALVADHPELLGQGGHLYRVRQRPTTGGQ